MQTDLTILAMAKGLASHATTRQSIVTENVANADTVGYRARGIKPFAEVYNGPGAPERGPATAAPTGPAQVFQASATRPGHTGFTEVAQRTAEATQTYEVSRLGSESPNGNSVSIEDQMARGASAVADHQMALGILRKSMDLIRMSIGRR